MSIMKFFQLIYSVYANMKINKIVVACLLLFVLLLAVDVCSQTSQAFPINAKGTPDWTDDPQFLHKPGTSPWRIMSVITKGQANVVTGVNRTANGITGFSLEQNYPNPFNPTTLIQYQIAKTSFVSIVVYDIAGREVQTLVREEKAQGKYSIPFTAGKFSSGVYFCVLRAGDFISTKKLTLLK